MQLACSARRVLNDDGIDFWRNIFCCNFVFCSNFSVFLEFLLRNSFWPLISAKNFEKLENI